MRLKYDAACAWQVDDEDHKCHDSAGGPGDKGVRCAEGSVNTWRIKVLVEVRPPPPHHLHMTILSLPRMCPNGSVDTFRVKVLIGAVTVGRTSIRTFTWF